VPDTSVELRYRNHADAYRVGFYPGAQAIDAQAIGFATAYYFEVVCFFLFCIAWRSEAMTLIFRSYQESDAGRVGILIADTFAEFNLSYATPGEQQLLLGPFRNARSTDPAHQKAIAEVLRAAILLVAEDEGEIVGVLRGRKERLQSLFVAGTHHRRGIGRRLVELFEQECSRQGATRIQVAATLFGVPFYTKMGYKKTTGARSMPCFDGAALPYQPMQKILHRGS
jgi:GNAT superfamily N-acetyltransferase